MNEERNDSLERKGSIGTPTETDARFLLGCSRGREERRKKKDPLGFCDDRYGR
jgi:hypothetical protein